MFKVSTVKEKNPIVNVRNNNVVHEDSSIFKFNRKIEPTKQAEGSIDCWLLSGINALNTTSWGKDAIKEAIEPDNFGGVYITLKGSPIENKKFHVSVEELYQAKKSGKYSSGDDDMLALELGVEKLYKLIDAKQLGEIDRCGDDDNKSYLGNMILNGTDRVLSVEELITGSKTKLIINNTHAINKWEGLTESDFNQTYQYLAEHKNDIAITVTFSSRPDIFGYRDKDDPVHGNHSYCLKKIVYNKYVIISDPYNSDKEIKMPWKRFITEESLLLFCTAKTPEKDKNIENALPKNYRKAEENHFNKIKAKKEKERLEILNERKQKEIKIKQILQKSKWESIINTFGDDGSRKLSNIFLDTLPIDKNNVLKFIDKYGTKIISKIDQDIRGWGNGEAKKLYILPIIKSLAEVAKDKGIAPNTIKEFENTCIDQELDAIFYTNEKVIIKEVEKILNLIKNN